MRRLLTKRAVVAALVMLALSACTNGGSDPDSLTASPAETVSTQPAASARNSPSPSSTPSPTGPGSAVDPLAFGDPWTYAWSTNVEHFPKTTWDGVFHDLERVECRWVEELGGACYVLTGVVTPTNIPVDVPNGRGSPPWIQVLHQGSPINDYGFAEVDSFEDAGYVDIDQVKVPVGTEVRFYYEFWIPDETKQPDTLVVGTVSYDDAIYLSAPATT